MAVIERESILSDSKTEVIETGTILTAEPCIFKV